MDTTAGINIKKGGIRMKKYSAPLLDILSFELIDVLNVSTLGNDNDGQDITDWYGILDQ